MPNSNFYVPHTSTVRQHLGRMLISFGFVAISIIFFQLALAQNTAPTLKPPYHLNFATLANPSFILPNPPLDGPIVVSETFDSSYSPTTTLSAPGWHQVTGTSAMNGYTWGRVISGTRHDSAWVANTALNGEPPLTPGIDVYTNGMQALLIYGPLDLSGDGLAVMTATYLLDSQPGDYFGVAISTDGTNFDAIAADTSADPLLGVTHSGLYNLKAYTRKSSVWIAFYFASNSDDMAGLGAFVNDVVIRATPLFKSYLPQIAKNYSPPTPPPGPKPALYNYTFGTGSGSDSQFLAWGGTYAESCGTDCTRWGQYANTAGHPDGAVNLYLTTLNDIAAASPNVTATTNYTYSADIYVIQGKVSARFGLIFGASLSTFGRDADGNPTFDPNRNFYKFDLQFSDTDNTQITAYRLSICQNDFTACTLIVQKTSLPTGLVSGTGTWNNLMIVRNGDNLAAIVNGTQLFSVTEGSFIGERKFGIFVHSRDLNSAANPLKIRFDNVQVYALP